MKQTIKVIAVNIAVLVALLLVLEVFLRLVGVDTVYQQERNTPGWKLKYQDYCREIAGGEVKFFNRFHTDGDGIFKAVPDSFTRLQGKKLSDFSVNAQGFRGNEFKFIDTPRPKILLIGDSFAWGFSAEPITKSFPDLLDEEGYHVYNGGIPGTDPQQYALIAEKYTPLLKPQVTAVCLYLGNDTARRPLLVKPGKNLYYDTSLGLLRGYDDKGNFFKDVREAVQYLKNRKCGNCESAWEKFRFKTVIGRALDSLLYRGPGLVTDNERKWVIDSLKRIEAVCLRNNSEFIIFLIPFFDPEVDNLKSTERNLPLFKDFQYYYPANLKKKDYKGPPDLHFNNKGHRKFADFIMEILKQKGFAPVKE